VTVCHGPRFSVPTEQALAPCDGIGQAGIVDDQAARILELVETGFSSAEVAAQLGISEGMVRAIKAHRTMGTYDTLQKAGIDGPAGEPQEVARAANLKFGLERDMQNALRAHMEQLDPKLTIVDGGKERAVNGGYIDILAEDDRGGLVVIELKSADAPDSAITQILSYIGALREEDRDRPVRGVLIARSFSTRVRLAAAASGVHLVEYGYEFSFKRVSP